MWMLTNCVTISAILRFRRSPQRKGGGNVGGKSAQLTPELLFWAGRHMRPLALNPSPPKMTSDVRRMRADSPLSWPPYLKMVTRLNLRHRASAERSSKNLTTVPKVRNRVALSNASGPESQDAAARQ